MVKLLRTIFICCCLATLNTTLASGQAMWLVLIFGDKAATENFHFNIEGGLVFSNIGNLNGKTDLVGTFGLGNFIRINDKWAFVPEFKPLSLRGERGLEDFVEIPPEYSNIESFQSKLVMNYIDIPLMFRYELSRKFFIATGPQVSFRTSAKIVTNGVITGGDREFTIRDDIQDETQWYDFAWPVEIGIHFFKKDKPGGLDFKARWTPGFVDVAREPIGESQFRHNTFQILVSIPFLKRPETDE